MGSLSSIKSLTSSELPPKKHCGGKTVDKQKMKPRIIVSLAIMAVAGAAAIGGTVAYFSDSEVSKNNTFTAGALDLKVDSECHYDGMVCAPTAVEGASGNVWQNETTNPNSSTYPDLLNTPCSCSWLSKDLTDRDLFFNFGDVKPGDGGENTISLTTNNNDSWLCGNLENITNNDNGCNGPEFADETAAYGAGNETCASSTAGIGQGELQKNLFVTIWKDVDCNNKLDTNNTGHCVVNGATLGEGESPEEDAAECTPLGTETACNGFTNDEKNAHECVWVPGKEQILVDNQPIGSSNISWPLFTPGVNGGAVLPGGTKTCLGFMWSVPTTAGNIIQTDNVKADLSFQIEQSRNNPNFKCANSETAPKVGANLSAYVAPTCATTVSGANSVQTAINGAAAGTTVCVDNTYTGEGDTGAIQVNIDNLTLAATTNGVAIKHPVELDNVGTKVTGFVGTVGQVESASEVAAFYINSTASNATISYNTVAGDGVNPDILTESGGINGGCVIENNLLSGGHQGIYLNPHTGTITIQKNDFNNNFVGIGNITGALVQNNQFNHTTAGQEAIGAGNGSFGDYNGSIVQFNNFLNGQKINTYTLIGNVNAPNNFFNLTGPVQETGEAVNFTPESGVQYAHN
jgi:predicted ribosomally synthesized peptide with SipW-like signal peptide